MAVAPPDVTHPAGPAVNQKSLFSGLKKDLSNALRLDAVAASVSDAEDAKTSGGRQFLRASDPDKPYLPGQPRVRLDGNNGAEGDLYSLPDYLRNEHLTKELDDILPFMKYIFVQTPSYRHIMPLHHQKAHARNVVVNEHPGLHLVWYYDMIFIKPIPAYFYSAAFWSYLKVADNDVFRAAAGFMRSYYFIIHYEIDYRRACELQLIPEVPETGKLPSYVEFCAFLDEFRAIDDAEVCRRFHYGELRLTRINRTAMLAGRSLAYFHIYPQWGSFLTHIIAPIITTFAVSSVVLNSMQVSLAAQQSAADPDSMSAAWRAFVDVSLWFPIAVICFLALILAFMLLGIVFMGFKDLISAKQVRQRKKIDREAGGKSHGMIW